MTDARVLFAGTPEFALVSLRALTSAGIVPFAVLTQPDRPAGRGKRLTASPVKQFAEEQGIEVSEARKVRPSLEDVFVQITGIEVDAMRKEKEKKGGGA